MPTFTSFQAMRQYLFPVEYELEHLKRKGDEEPWWYLKETSKEELIEFMDNLQVSQQTHKVG